jgi:diacylglycerol kinase (ATP)
MELRHFEPLTYRVRIDGEERTLPAMFIAVANGGRFGGGMHIAPSASMTDGLLDVTIIHPVSRASMIRLLPKTFNGSFVADPAVECLQASEVVIDGDGLVGLADGEALGYPPFGITCEPGALTVFTPNPDPLTRRRKNR